MSVTATELRERLAPRFTFLYGEEKAGKLVDRVTELASAYDFEIEAKRKGNDGSWTEKDSILITYGDTIKEKGEYPLSTLLDFTTRYIGDSISGIHILPFFPFSSDDGFSVIDYRKVREDLGHWVHVEQLSDHYKIMADVVINHVSQESEWFRNFREKKAPGSSYFIEMQPGKNLSEVTRPRNTPLLKRVNGEVEERFVWTTFSQDQIDVDFRNPDVLFEFLDIILFYVSHGISVLRLDAIAYLWKRIGTNCIHLPETHEVVKLIRDLLEVVAPHVTIITETNVPHKENISYFGEGDEAQMIYQFSLPPLLLHALLFDNSSYLTEWAQKLDKPPEGCYYFNFLASHDGIGVRPLEGLIPDHEFNLLLQSVRERDGYISQKTNPSGEESPYELNITYFDALKDDAEADENLQVERFICAQTIMLTLKGIPGIYLHSMTATPNYSKGVETQGYARAINRKKWDENELISLLNDESSSTAKVFSKYQNLLDIRKEQPAFHPDGEQKVFDTGNALFAVQRSSQDGSQTILSISNLTDSMVRLNIDESGLPLSSDRSYINLLGKAVEKGTEYIEIIPYQTYWLEI